MIAHSAVTAVYDRRPLPKRVFRSLVVSSLTRTPTRGPRVPLICGLRAMPERGVVAAEMRPWVSVAAWLAADPKARLINIAPLGTCQVFSRLKDSLFLTKKSRGRKNTPDDLAVTSVLKPGENHVEVKVSNLCPSRIIGDRQPCAIRRCAWLNFKPFRADTPLTESGLLGPVKILRRMCRRLYLAIIPGAAKRTGWDKPAAASQIATFSAAF